MRHHGPPTGGGPSRHRRDPSTDGSWPVDEALPLHVQVEERYDHVLADGSVVTLQQVSSRPPIPEYLRRLARRRHFIQMQAWMQASTKNSGMLLGNLWLIIAPLLDAGMYFVIFGLLFGGRRDEYFVLRLIVGVLLFTITTRMVTSAATSISSNAALIRAFAFPRAALPIATVLREVISSLPVFLAVIVLILLIPPHATLTFAWLLVPFLFALQVALGLGAGFIVARLASDLPDVRRLIPYATRMFMYGSAILFSVDRFDSIPWLAVLVRHNPTYLMVDMYRTVFVYGEIPQAAFVIEFTLWAVGLLVLGFLYFWEGEVRYGRQVK